MDYFDIGLFFDYCIVCCMFGQMSKGKDFFNLFFYIGSVIVYVGLGGVCSIIIVDMLCIYLEWVECNLCLNGLIGCVYCLIQVDCLVWLCEVNEQFDLIFIDLLIFFNLK